QDLPLRWQEFFCISMLKSSSHQTPQPASRSRRSDGSSSGQSRGSSAAETGQGLENLNCERSPSCALLQFARCLESYAIRYGLFGRTLKLEMVRRRAMARMAVITKSFAPDFELCAALNRSVLDNSPDTVQHHIIVPRSDLKLFGRLALPRTRVRCEADLL